VILACPGPLEVLRSAHLDSVDRSITSQRLKTWCGFKTAWSSVTSPICALPQPIAQQYPSNSVEELSDDRSGEQTRHVYRFSMINLFFMDSLWRACIFWDSDESLASGSQRASGAHKNTALLPLESKLMSSVDSGRLAPTSRAVIMSVHGLLRCNMSGFSEKKGVHQRPSCAILPPGSGQWAMLMRGRKVKIVILRSDAMSLCYEQTRVRCPWSWRSIRRESARSGKQRDLQDPLSLV